MKVVKVEGVVHGDRQRIVDWLRSGDGIGGDDHVARAIADAIESGEDIEYDRKRQVEDYVKAVGTLARKDQEYLYMAPTLPKLYESGVRYVASTDGEGFYDIPTLLAGDRTSNIASLIAWRVAELWAQGIEVSPYVKWCDREGGGRVYTMVVRWPDGSEENVIALLGGAQQE